MRDPGLQPERTALAWQRTAMATVLVCAAIAVLAIRVDALPFAVTAGGLAGTICIVVLRFFPQRLGPSPATADVWKHLMATAGAVAVASVLCCVTIIVVLM